MHLIFRPVQISLLAVVCSWTCAAGSNIAGFGTVGARSHQFVILRIGQELQARGHNFTLLLSSGERLDRDGLGSKAFAGLNIVHFDGPDYVGTTEWFANQPRDVTQAMLNFQAEQLAVAEHLWADKTTVRRLKDTRFDAYLKDAWYWPADLLQDLLGVPAIDVLPFPIGMPMLEQSLSIPNQVAYVPQVGVDYTANMSLRQRTHNYLQAWLVRLFVNRLSNSYIKTFIAKTGQPIRSYARGRTSAVAVIASVDWAVEYPFPVPPKVQLVGPILAEPSKPLPEKLDTFLDAGIAQGLGAVYVSMGSAARLAEEALLSMAQALSALPNPVLWKLSKRDLPSNVTQDWLQLGPNIKLLEWAPQNDILGHSAVKAFVTHAGSNGLYEAAYHGKPVVPIMNEQPGNAAKAEYHGFGVTVQPHSLIPVSKTPIQNAVSKILTDPAYLRNAQNIQARLVNPHRTPAQQAADVVERVIVTGGEDYLETQQHTLWWWQLALLDVKLFLGLCILAVLGIVIMILYAVFTGARLLLRSVSGRKLQRATSWKRKAL